MYAWPFSKTCQPILSFHPAHFHEINTKAPDKLRLVNKLIKLRHSESKMCSPALVSRPLHAWLSCQKCSLCDYCSSREPFFCVIKDYPIILFLLLIAATALASKNHNHSRAFSDCHALEKKKKEAPGSTNQSRVTADQMIVGCHLRHPRPKIEGRFNPFRMTRTEWMWEGRCIEDEWAVGLCKEACKLYWHEQQVAKGTTLGFILSGNYFLKGRGKGREPFVSEISHKRNL